MARPSSWENIGPDMTASAHKSFKRGQILVFKMEDDKTKFKIMSMTDGIWVKKIVTYNKEEAERLPYVQNKFRGKKVKEVRNFNADDTDQEEL